MERGIYVNGNSGKDGGGVNDIRLELDTQPPNNTIKPGDRVKGKLVVNVSKETRVDDITIALHRTMEATQPGGKSVPVSLASIYTAASYSRNALL